MYVNYRKPVIFEQTKKSNDDPVYNEPEATITEIRLSINRIKVAQIRGIFK